MPANWQHHKKLASSRLHSLGDLQNDGTPAEGN
jgi:hypothetical protein